MSPLPRPLIASLAGHAPRVAGVTLALALAAGCAPEAPAPGEVPPPPSPAGPIGPRPGGGGPIGPPPGAGPGVSGAVLQDPSGFPPFHDLPAPAGPPITSLGAFSPPEKLTGEPGGGYRPQIAVAPDGRLHAVFYERAAEGDLIRHRHRGSGEASWSAPAALGFPRDRNWGPDLVARADGSVVVSFDHALPDFRSRGWQTTWRDGRWAPPEALTPDDGGEVGSGHIAHGPDDQLAYVWIGKALDPDARFRARWRWFRDGAWSPIHDFTDGAADAWHTNVERRPDGSVLAGWDVGAGGSATRLFVVEGRDGRFGTPEDLTATGKPGERPHFAFGPDGRDHVTWFHKEGGRPLAVYVRSGHPGAWGPVQEPSAGVGGFHFDPDIAVAPDGTLCLVWGWDAGTDAELVYSLDRGQGWEPPQKIADLDWGKPGLPSIDVDSQGVFHVVWNQGVRGDNDVFYARLDPLSPARPPPPAP